MRRVPHPAVAFAATCLLVLAATRGAIAGDEVRGETLFRKCASCHTVDAGARHRAGPALHGVFGRRAGSAPGYRYSEALRISTVVWDDGTLDAYIADAEGFIPGTKMGGGLTQAADRADLLAYLKRATTHR